MKNLNFGKQGGFRHKGNFLPKQTKKQTKRMQRMQKRVIQNAVVAQRQQEISSLDMKTFELSADAVLLAVCLTRKRGF